MIAYLFLPKTSCFKSEQLDHKHCSWYTSNFPAVSLSGSELHRAGEACSHSDPGKRSDVVHEVPGAVQLHYQETPPLQSMRTCECSCNTQHTVLTSVRRCQSDYQTPLTPNITNFFIWKSPECSSLVHTSSFYLSVVKWHYNKMCLWVLENTGQQESANVQHLVFRWYVENVQNFAPGCCMITIERIVCV